MKAVSLFIADLLGLFLSCSDMLMSWVGRVLMSLCILDDLLKSTELAPNVRSRSDSDLKVVGLIDE